MHITQSSTKADDTALEEIAQATITYKGNDFSPDLLISFTIATRTLIPPPISTINPNFTELEKTSITLQEPINETVLLEALEKLTQKMVKDSRWIPASVTSPQHTLEQLENKRQRGAFYSERLKHKPPNLSQKDESIPTHSSPSASSSPLTPPSSAVASSSTLKKALAEFPPSQRNKSSVRSRPLIGAAFITLIAGILYFKAPENRARAARWLARFAPTWFHRRFFNKNL